MPLVVRQVLDQCCIPTLLQVQSFAQSYTLQQHAMSAVEQTRRALFCLSVAYIFYCIGFFFQYTRSYEHYLRLFITNTTQPQLSVYHFVVM